MIRSTSPDKSPWWYQRRALVIVFIYLIGFYAGSAASALYERAPSSFPSFVLVASALHSRPSTALWIATALSFAGFLIRYWGSTYLSPEVVWSPNALQGKLLVDGPFRYVRNPLYLGNILLALAVGSLATPIGWAIIVLGNIWFSWLLGTHEAHGMRERYGDIYERYRKTVPAFLPRLWPARVEGSVHGKPSLLGGLKAEALMLGFAVAMAAYTLTADLRIFWGIALAGWLAQYTFRRQTLARFPTSAT